MPKAKKTKPQARPIRRVPAGPLTFTWLVFQNTRTSASTHQNVQIKVTATLSGGAKLPQSGFIACNAGTTSWPAPATYLGVMSLSVQVYDTSGNPLGSPVVATAPATGNAAQWAWCSLGDFSDAENDFSVSLMPQGTALNTNTGSIPT